MVYNTLGQKVAELVNRHQTSGNYTVEFNASVSSSTASNLPSGVYIYKLHITQGSETKFSSTKKMILTK